MPSGEDRGHDSGTPTLTRLTGAWRSRFQAENMRFSSIFLEIPWKFDGFHLIFHRLAAFRPRGREESM